MSTAAGSSGSISANQDKVETDDPISYTWNVYVKDTGMTGTMQTVIKLPDNDDSGLLGNKNSDGDYTGHGMSIILVPPSMRVLTP